jgi:hypothetical protein
VVVPIRIGTQRDRGFADAQAVKEGTEVAA